MKSKSAQPIVSALIATAIGAMIAIVCVPCRALAAANMLLNGDLSKGSENQPDNWRTEAWLNDPTAFKYDWTHPSAGGPGELQVVALKANDARWMQSLTLAPGLYHFSGEIRTESVGTQATGATISIMEDGIMSSDIRGTTAWEPAGFYLKVGSRGADVEVALRLGGYGSLNTGRAWFRNVVAEKIDALPKDAAPVFDLDKIRKAEQPLPIGHPITLVAMFVFLAAAAVYGWRMYAIEQPVAPAAPPPNAKRRTKSGRRA